MSGSFRVASVVLGSSVKDDLSEVGADFVESTLPGVICCPRTPVRRPNGFLVHSSSASTPGALDSNRFRQRLLTRYFVTENVSGRLAELFLLSDASGAQKWCSGNL